MISDCRGLPMSMVTMSFKDAWHTAWVSAPTLATPTHKVLPLNTRKENSLTS